MSSSKTRPTKLHLSWTLDLFGSRIANELGMHIVQVAWAERIEEDLSEHKRALQQRGWPDFKTFPGRVYSSTPTHEQHEDPTHRHVHCDPHWICKCFAQAVLAQGRRQ